MASSVRARHGGGACVSKRRKYAAWQARREALRRGEGWLQAYDKGVRNGLRPVMTKGWDIWWDWCAMHQTPPRRPVDGVTLRRQGRQVWVQGTEVQAVRRVIRSERRKGEQWAREETRAGYETCRKKGDGPVLEGVKTVRKGARVVMDARSLVRMCKALGAAGGTMLGREQLPFGDG